MFFKKCNFTLTDSSCSFIPILLCTQRKMRKTSIRNSIAPTTPPTIAPISKSGGLGVLLGRCSVGANTSKELFPMPTLFTAKTLIEYVVNSSKAQRKI
jgi:hypothetical protein